MKNGIYIGISILVGLIIWFLPEPEGVNTQGWHLFALFVATMISVILKPLPMGVVSLISLTVALVTHTLTFADAFSGFSNEVVWLVVFAFFVARGFISTG